MFDDSPPDSPQWVEPELAEDFADDFAEDFAEADDNLVSAEEGHSDLVYNTILNAYHETWAEFHTWDQTTAAEHLAGLAVPLSVAATADLDYAFESEEGSEDVGLRVSMDVKADESLGTFTICDWDADGHLEKTTKPVLSRRGRRTRSHNTCFEEHASYEACTPSNSSIWSNDDLSVCRFVKYGDDPGFNVRGYLRNFTSIQWQQSTWRGIDMGLIAARTIQKVTTWANEDPSFNELQIFWDDIDAAGIVSVDIPALLDRLKHRDCIGWPSNSFNRELDQLAPLWRSGYEPWMTSRMAGTLASFCPKAGCVQFECFNDPFPTGWTSGRMGSTELDNEELKARYGPRKPCSADCFLTDNPNHQAPIGWDSTENTHLLDEMLAAEPDALPCVISQILLGEVPCYRVFARREAKIVVSSAAANPNGPPRWKDSNPDPLSYTMPIRCDHEGPCTSQNCSCFREGVHCQWNCLCDLACAIRYAGCDCSTKYRHGQTTCSTQSDPAKETTCDCAKTKWECHPMLCDCAIHSKRRPLLIEQNAEPMCKNVDVQRTEPAPIEVKSAMYGMGAFARRLIKRNAYLGEYAAELFPWTAAYGSTIGEFLNARGNNYAFTVSKKVVADAANVGNETRFFNHSPDANVTADIKVVNGDHKVAFYASRKIRKGEEMLLDYGPSFFKGR